MSGCGNCCGNCGGCGELILSEGEIDMLRLLAQIPFLPVARKADSVEPVYPEDPTEETSLILQCLEKRGLISLDYDKPLKGWDYSSCKAYPVHGSFALTAKGQQVIELMELQGLDGE